MSAETKTVKCNKCQKDGLHWGTKQVKDKTFNILLEADGSEHRPYKDGKAECRTDAVKKPDEKQSTLAPSDLAEMINVSHGILQAIGKLSIQIDELKTLIEKKCKE